MNTIKAKQLIESLPKNAKVVEIAGSTPEGTEFLIKHGIRLAPHVEITNVTSPILMDQYSEHPFIATVDRVVEVRKMPYASSSLDMIICSYLSKFSDNWKGRHLNQLGHMISDYQYTHKLERAKFNLRIAFLREARRVLKPGGIVLIEGPFQGDVAMVDTFGYKLVYIDHPDEDDHDVLLLQKPSR